MLVLLAGLAYLGMWLYRKTYAKVKDFASRGEEIHRDRLANRPADDAYTEEWLSEMSEEAATNNQPNSPSHQFDCKGCGAGLDPMLTACSYCGRPHNRIDVNTMPTELIVSNAAKWVGLMEEIDVTGQILRPGASGWSGDIISFAEMNSGVRQYLTVLDLRSERDPLAKRKLHELSRDVEVAKHRLDELKKAHARSLRRIGLVTLLFSLFLFLYLILMAFLEG